MRPFKPNHRSPLLAGLLLLAGCAGPALQLPPPLKSAERMVQQPGGNAAAGAEPGRVEAMPVPPDASKAAAPRAPAPVPSKPAPKDTPASINFEQVPLTSVIQVVYADVLGRTLQIDPQVMARRDLVTFRTPPQESPAQIERAMELLLRSYGLSVVDVGGLVRVVPDGAQAGTLPEIRRGQALPETPAAMRPIFQLVPLTALRVNEVVGLLKSLVGTRVTIQEDAVRNAVILSGTGSAVGQAIEALRAIDQPMMSGRAALRVTPTFWSVSDLATTLHQVLTAEGYTLAAPSQAMAPGGVRYPIILLPVAAINSLLVFAQDDAVAAHVQRWITQLDQPGRQTAGRNLFTYTAKNLSAETLARTIAQLFEGGAGNAARPAAAATAAPGAAQPAGFGTVAAGSPAAAQTSFAGGRIVVDANSNTLVVNTTPENYAQLVSLLNQFDRPPKSALIEVTVAEVELEDGVTLGVDWLFEKAGLSAADQGGLIAGSRGARLVDGGLVLRRLSGAADLRVTLNALATSKQANILSSPRIVARNGETAQIQVGSEVPIVTSQATGVAGSTGLLTSVQYRNTGVLLKVKPSIYAGDRIDLEVSQEVSDAGKTDTGVGITPTFSTKKIETRLTLEHGSPVMLGGLISSTRSDTDAGVPLLKDVPVLGNLFKRRNDSLKKRELLVLITPYILNDNQDAVQLTDSFKALLPAMKEAGKPGILALPRPAE